MESFMLAVSAEREFKKAMAMCMSGGGRFLGTGHEVLPGGKGSRCGFFLKDGSK